MAGQPAIFHALLRPSILQILRATGYHSAKGAVVDSLTDMAACYMSVLCETTAAHAAHNRGEAGDFSATDIQLALQDVGALQPEQVATEQAWSGVEDMRGVDDFVRWFAGPRMRELMEMAGGDGETDATDYLNGLKKKHSKSGEDTKYHGTILGRPLDAVADIQVEGGRAASIDAWMAECGSDARARASAGAAAASLQPNGLGQRREEVPSPAVSSGLSSFGDRLDGADAQPADRVADGGRRDDRPVLPNDGMDADDEDGDDRMELVEE